MNFHLGSFLTSLQEEVYIYRGQPGYNTTQVAVDSEGNALSLMALVDDSGPSSSFEPYIQLSDDEFMILFMPPVSPFLLNGETATTTLQEGDSLVRKKYMENSPLESGETEKQRLIRNVKDTSTGVLTISYIDERFNAQSIRAKDIKDNVR